MIKMHLKSKPVPVVMKYLIEKCMHSNPKERMDFDTIKLYLYMTDTSYIPLSSTSGMTAGGASVLSSKSNSSDGNNTIPQSGSNFTKPNNFSNSNSSLVTAAASATARTQRSGNAHTNTTNKKLPNANHNYTGIVSGFNIDMRSVLFAEYEPINNMSVLSERGFEMTNMNNNDGVGNNRVNRFRPLQETSYQDESGTRSKKRNDRRVSPQTKKRILLIFSVIVAACLIVAIALGILFGLKPGSSPAKNNGSSNGDSTVNYIPWAQDQLFGGANTYFIQNLPELDQDEAISILAAANIKVIRTIITATPARYLNSTSLEIYDVEWPECGVYNDTILSRLDRVMWKAYESGMKLIIAFHNRDNLGCGKHQFSDMGSRGGEFDDRKGIEPLHPS